MVFEICERTDKQTNRHTNTLITILCTRPAGGQVIITPGALELARFLKLLPLMTSTDRRPVDSLYARPTISSGSPPCCIDDELSADPKLPTDAIFDVNFGNGSLC